jgi:hypothetical protein
MLALFCLFAHAQTPNVYVFTFAPGSPGFILDYGDNRAELNRLKTEVSIRYGGIFGDTLAVFVKGYCKDSLSLATVRSNHIKSVLITEAGMREEFFITENSAASIDGKTDLARVEVRIPQPQERLAENIERRKKTGEPVYSAPQPAPTPKEEPAAVQAGTVKQPEEEKPVVIQAQPPIVETPDNNLLPSAALKETAHLSIRTNLLYWAAATPNLGVEYRPANSIGILVNGAYSHWIWSDKSKHHRTWIVQPEIRRYFGENKRWFLGIEGHAGQFNFKFSDTGYQGDALGGGLTGGYRLQLNKCLDMDFSLGLGYTQLKYDSYYRSNDVMVRKENNMKKNVFAPTQAGVSLIWKLK